MGRRNRLFTPFIMLIMLVVSCDKYDDSELTSALNHQKEAIENQSKAISSLETSLKEVNTSAETMGRLLKAYSDGACIKEILPISGDKGYTIALTDGTALTVYNGADGQVAGTLALGISEDGYWTLGGEPLVSASGAKARAVGDKGADAMETSGEKGVPGVSPRLRAEGGKIQVSVDGGASWSDVSDMTGPAGDPGDPGAPGADGVSLIKAVAPSTDGKRLNITLADGTVWSMTVEKQAYIVINKKRTSLTAYVGDQSFVMNKVEKCTFTMGANTYKAPCPGVADQYVDYKHQVTLTKTYWIMESWITRELQAAVEGAAGETMPEESIRLYENKNREFIAFYSNWWTELTKIYGDVFSMEFNIPTEAQLERAMGTGACYCVNAIASDWFYYPLSRNEDKIDPTGWISSWFGYGKVHKSNELQNCLDYQTRTGITLRSSSIDRKDRYQTKGDYGNIHLVIYDSDLSI